MPAPQFKRQDLIFLILPNVGEIFQNIQDEVKMLDVEVEKKCLCKIPCTPGRGQTGATIWFILRQKGFKMQRVAKLSGHHSLIIFSLLFNSFLSSKLTFIVLSSSIRLNMKFFQRCSMWRWEKAPWQSEEGFEVFQREAESGNVLATCALTISTIATAATIKLAGHTICQKQNSCWSVFLLQWDTFEREL